ncbi:hypothetical protein EYF80_030641 [Liparis tanakae]|uniref:Uncharacterized protein n=1 Tax=Liparis tanakae TaxID=230148 RepID=A0A4Z2GZQ4_9TELE|nr:hypothetical protein EYF80_030641 [Liparis tanakae]
MPLHAGWHTARKFGLKRPMEYLAMSVRDWLAAAPNTSEEVRGRLLSYHDQCEGDHDSAQQLVGYGVLFEGVSDGLIVTEETPFEGVVLRDLPRMRQIASSPMRGTPAASNMLRLLLLASVFIGVLSGEPRSSCRTWSWSAQFFSCHKWKSPRDGERMTISLLCRYFLYRCTSSNPQPLMLRSKPPARR